MAGFLGEHVRCLAAAAVAASFLGAAAVCAEASPEESRSLVAQTVSLPVEAVAVFAPRADAALRSVDGGVRIWIVQELRRGGIPVVDLTHTDAVAAQHRSAAQIFLQGKDAPALARETEAGVVLLSRMQAKAGQLELSLRAYDAAGKVLAVGHGSGRLASLGEALMAALAPVRAALGAGPGDGVPPWLPELGAYERAVELLSSGSLASAWNELSGIQSPTADALREDIVAKSATAGVAATDRSRLASARDAPDPDWLTIRHQLQQERNVPVLLASAAHASAGGDPEGALALFAEAAKADPQNLDAERGRARMLFALERHVEAKAAFERVLSRVPDDVEARVALASNPTLAPVEQARLWLGAGERQSRKLDDQGARASFERAVQLDAGVQGATRRNVGRLEETLGNDGEALAAYNEARAADPSDLESESGLGRMQSRSGDAVAAGAAFEKVLARRPGDFDALYGLGDALLAQGRAENAVVHLEQAVAQAPRDAGTRTALARALDAAGQEDAALRMLDPTQVALADRPLLLTQAAELHAEQGRLAEARSALEQAVALEPDEPPLRAALAKLHAKAGDAAAAKAEEQRVATLSGASALAASGATLAEAEAKTPGDREVEALVGSFPLTTQGRRPIARVAWLGLVEPAGWRAKLRSWAMPQQVDPGALDAALQGALGARFEVVPEPRVPEPAQPAFAKLRSPELGRGDVALVNDVLAADASFVARWLPQLSAGLFDPPNAPVTLELRMLGGRSEAEVFVLANTATLADSSAFVRWNWRAGIFFGVLGLLLLAPIVRGWGSIVVVLDYERSRGSEGFFSIELSRRPGKTKRGGSRLERQRRMRWWSRFSRHGVRRETRMRMLPARSWVVTVHGLLKDPISQELIGHYLEERKVCVRRGKSIEMRFDFRRRAAPIEVRLHHAEKAAPVAACVAVLGVPDSLRFVADDVVTVFLEAGTRTLLIGVEDRVFEQVVEVRDLTGQSISVQVGNVDSALFSGCLEAVDLCLSGDLIAASRALDRRAKNKAATLLRAMHHRLRGEAEEAARCAPQAREQSEAAELVKQSPQVEPSAELVEKAGDVHPEAQQHAVVDDSLTAAQAYEEAFDYTAAIDAYRAGGRHDKVLELLEKTGRFFEAGGLAVEQRDEDRAIRCFSQVGARDAEYAEACEALSNLFAQRRIWELAVDKAREAIDARGADDAPLDALEGLARLLESADRPAEALAIWENLLKRDSEYAGATERVEGLRRALAELSRASAAAPPKPAPAPTPATTSGRDARYEVLGELGRGAMGVVLKARDKRLGRVVALKRMPENLKTNPTAVQLFVGEARAAAALSHPNIVTLFDADQQADGTYYLTMELLEGSPLDHMLKKRGKLTARDTLRLGVQIAKGLQFAHEKGIVHRDIKTANLFFTNDRSVKIMDFGLAKMNEEVRRAATVIGGTPHYMAPEQAVGGKVDHRADLYAFGVTLFELVTGGVPFSEGDAGYHHRHTPAPDPRSRVADVPEGLAVLIQRLMAKAPDQRPATTAEVVRTLEKLLSQQTGGS